MKLKDGLMPDEHITEDLTAFTWAPQPDATKVVLKILEELVKSSPFASRLATRLLEETGTRLFDWLDHLGIPALDPSLSHLGTAGFRREQIGSTAYWQHPGGLLPRIRELSGQARQLVIKVESIVDFLLAQRMSGIQIYGDPLASLRIAQLSQGDSSINDVEVWGVERHGSTAFDVDSHEFIPVSKIIEHAEAFRLRRRDWNTDEEGFQHANRLIDAALRDLGQDRTCDLFFAAEREYWLRRNRAGRVQKARQNGLGLGWGNHDHHTYRSSRHCFASLIAFLERLGFVCRERFYAGREAGWGAQVIEQSQAGITIFADVDLSPEELSHDFAHESLPSRHELGTVGLWCALHGEAFLQAGMHHLECQFDFSATRDQLKQVGIETMPPFTDFPYLKQAFTQGEIWAVDPERVRRLVDANQITREQADRFLQNGALGSHLEILQRNDGYKGFNQSGINQIISATDPRRTTNSASK